MSKNITIAVDAMGGDGSPKKIIDGIAHHNKNSKSIFYKIFGDKEKILSNLPSGLSKDVYEIFDTKNNVKGTDTPLEAAKRGKDTSMWLAIESVKNKEADAIISAGNTGALLVIAKLNLKMIENIDKPALSALWPNEKGMSVVLDLGANIECSSKNLVDFSVMGASLYKSLYPNDTPNVALLNIGSEELKGNETIKETYQLLNEKNIKDFIFSGYIEGDKLMDGDVNVIISDGFTGNVALKTAEGVSKFITDSLKKSLTSSLYAKILSFLLKNKFQDFKNSIDPRNFNGGIFIGVNGIVIKSHGNADSHAFANAIEFGLKCLKSDLLNKIKSNVSS